MTPAEAIEVSTRRSAECMRIDAEIGTLAPASRPTCWWWTATRSPTSRAARGEAPALVMKGGVAVTGPLAAGLTAPTS